MLAQLELGPCLDIGTVVDGVSWLYCMNSAVELLSVVDLVELFVFWIEYWSGGQAWRCR